MANVEKGLIFDIQGHSVHDGPGTRTLIFFSGCPLRCTWCANPEGQLIAQRVMFRGRLCKACPQRCVSQCHHNSFTPRHDDLPLVSFDSSKCLHCDDHPCIESCYKGAIQLSGKWYTVDDLMRIVRRDSNYWGAGGGISISGGEPLAQIGFVSEFLERCHKSYISVCVETSGLVPRESLQAILPYVEWFFIDVKHMDTERHRAGTGVGNELILRNIEWLSQSGWKGRLMLRMPVVPGFNDSVENAEATAQFMEQCNLHEINLLPFHRLGASKHEQLGSKYAFNNVGATKPGALEPLAALYRERGLTCYIGSDTPF